MPNDTTPLLPPDPDKPGWWWLLSMFDLDRKAWRLFAVKDMSNVRVMEDDRAD